MDTLLETIKQKLDSPNGDMDAMILLTGHGFDNWYAGRELTLQDVKPGLLSLMIDIEMQVA